MSGVAALYTIDKSLQSKKPCFSGTKGKNDYCDNLGLKNVTHNKKFWKL